MPAPSEPYRKLRIAYSILFALILSFALFEELYFRHWLFHRLGRNSLIAGSLPNFLAVLLLSNGVAIVKLPENRERVIRIVLSVAAGLICYEIAQIWMPNRTFDWGDVAATLLGGVFIATLLLGLRGMIFRSK